ncbi:Hypothetical predicted protein, partial [Podarcis lilfordi]
MLIFLLREIASPCVIDRNDSAVRHRHSLQDKIARMNSGEGVSGHPQPTSGMMGVGKKAQSQGIGVKLELYTVQNTSPQTSYYIKLDLVVTDSGVVALISLYWPRKPAYSFQSGLTSRGKHYMGSRLTLSKPSLAGKSKKTLLNSVRLSSESIILMHFSLGKKL